MTSRGFVGGLVALVAGAFILVRLGLSPLASSDAPRTITPGAPPIMIGGAVLLIVLGLDGSLGLFDGALLLGLLVACTMFLVRQSRAEPASTGPDEFAQEMQPATAGRWEAALPAQLARWA